MNTQVYFACQVKKSKNLDDGNIHINVESNIKNCNNLLINH